MSVESDIQKLDPGAIVELFTLDASALGAGIFHFHAGTNELTGDVVWGGVTYSRYAVAASGFERTGNGTSPRPKLKAANIKGVLGATANAYDDLVGAIVTRTRTFVKYLDAVNFTVGNPLADPLVVISSDIYYIDRKSYEGPVFVEWELASPLDLAGAKLPGCQIIANSCPWRYRGPECNYTGGACADAADVPTTDITKDACGKRLSSCKLRFPGVALRFGGFPAAGLTRS